METAYIVIGHTNDAPVKVWGVQLYADEVAAAEHAHKATNEAKRIHANLKRAVMLRGKPFSSAELRRFWANNSYDPQMEMSENGATYVYLSVPLAPGLALMAGDAQRET
ncbi:MAG: hypothetical protein GXP38_02195 [Chloroflexi bacterium]|nr:hypothetical protein [Chloroflexota bacterium]